MRKPILPKKWRSSWPGWASLPSMEIFRIHKQRMSHEIIHLQAPHGHCHLDACRVLGDFGQRCQPQPFRPPDSVQRSIRIGWRGKKFSAGLSESDGSEKKIPQGHPNRMERKKVFRRAIRIGWSRKSFPRGHPNRMEGKKVFRGAIRIGWRGKKFSTGLSESDRHF